MVIQQRLGAKYFPGSNATVLIINIENIPQRLLQLHNHFLLQTDSQPHSKHFLINYSIYSSFKFTNSNECRLGGGYTDTRTKADDNAIKPNLITHSLSNTTQHLLLCHHAGELLWGEVMPRYLRVIHLTVA